MPPQIDLIRSERLPGSSASDGVGRQGSGIPRQQTTLSVDLQDPVPADDFQRQPPRSSASKRPSGQGPRPAPAFLLGSSASTRPSAPTSRILGQQTIYCNTAPTSRSSASKRPSALTSRILRQRQTCGQRLIAPTLSLGQQTAFSANLLDPRQANDVQRRLREFLASKTHPTPTSSHRPANPSAPTSGILGKQRTAPI